MTIRIGAVMTSDDSVSAAPAHIPVMLEEALAGLNLRNDGTYLDGSRPPLVSGTWRSGRRSS